MTFRAAQGLVDLGHTRIAALAGRPHSFRARQRLAGFHAGLAERNAAPDPSLVVADLTTSAEARAVIERLMALDSPPTAVLALNLGISTGVLLDRIVNDRRYAFIALDEHDLSVGFGVSAVVRDPQEVGRQAARLAVERIGDPPRAPRTVTLRSVVVRRGTGEIPAETVLAHWNQRRSSSASIGR